MFKISLKYAQSLNPDKIFILSAKYGLLNLDDEIEPYNETLNEKTNYEIKEWAIEVIKKLSKETFLDKDKFIFLAGNSYRKFLIPYIKNYDIPMYGLSIGRQLQYLKNVIQDD